MITEIYDEELGLLQVNDHDKLFDADQAVFFARQLEFIKARTYDVKYPNLKYRDLFPVSNEAGEGAASVTYRTYDQAGVSELIGAYAKDLPRADIGGQETVIQVKGYGISVGWTTKELREAAMTGLPIDSRKMNAAMRGNEQTFNRIAFFGEAAAGLNGVFTHPNVPTNSVPNGALGDPFFSEKTPLEIILDLNNCVNDIFTNTLMVEVPNKLALPPVQRALISTTPMSADNNTTILKFFVENNEFIASMADVVGCNECEAGTRFANGQSQVDVMFAFRSDPDTAQFEIPMELVFHPEQREGLEIIVPAEATTGGLNIYYPLAFNICEEI